MLVPDHDFETLMARVRQGDQEAMHDLVYLYSAG
jgi:hypothetical protein